MILQFPGANAMLLSVNFSMLEEPLDKICYVQMGEAFVRDVHLK
jgi:hypothetical protein